MVVESAALFGGCEVPQCRVVESAALLGMTFCGWRRLTFGSCRFTSMLLFGDHIFAGLSIQVCESERAIRHDAGVNYEGQQ